MDSEIKKQFDEIRSDIAEFFDFVRAIVVTKDDLKGFATKDDLKGFATKDDMERGFESVRSELRAIDDRLTRLELRIAALSKGSAEDTDALASDYIFVRRRLDVVEDALRKYGIPISEVKSLDNSMT